MDLLKKTYLYALDVFMFLLVGNENIVERTTQRLNDDNNNNANSAAPPPIQITYQKWFIDCVGAAGDS